MIRVSPFNRHVCVIWISTHLKLCLADAIHKFKWVKIIQIWPKVVQQF